MATTANHPLPASAEARETKIDRLRFLEAWAMDNPLATNEAAREAVRARFGLGLGSSVISRTMRAARHAWEAQRRAAARAQVPMTPPPLPTRPAPEEDNEAEPTLQTQILDWARGMRGSGVRLIEIMPDGRVRFEIEGFSV